MSTVRRNTECSKSLAGRVTLVTGAASGIGRASTLLMAERGSHTIVFDIDGEKARAVAEEARGLGVDGAAWSVDVADIGAVTRAVEEAENRFGKIDILVNNAGISGREATFASIDEAAFDRMLDIHVKGSFFLTQRVVPGMIERGFGRIINVSSNRGMVGYQRSSHYCAAKAAMLGMTKAWAKEFASHGILVNAVAPGVVDTPMNTWSGRTSLEAEASWNLLKRWASPEEIAYSIAYLASEETAFMTGQVLTPNGGDPIVGI